MCFLNEKRCTVLEMKRMGSSKYRQYDCIQDSWKDAAATHKFAQSHKLT